MGRRIFSSLLAMALIFSLPVFSLADGGEVILKDSGSPEVSLMALRSIAANDGISLAAAEGNSGQFGYNIESYLVDVLPEKTVYNNSLFYIFRLSLQSGSYSFRFSSSTPSNLLNVYDGNGNPSIPFTYSIDGSYAYVNFELSDSSLVRIQARYADLDTSLIDFSGWFLIPVEGVSCGWSVNEAFSETNRRDQSETFTWNFGSQPAGNYILNAYHYGIAYDVDWNICYGSSIVGSDSRFIPVTNLDGVSTALVSHGGGDLILSGTVTFSHPYGDGFFDGSGSYSEYNGSGSFSVDIFQRDNWSYAVSDVVIIPLESAGLEQFGIFGSFIGFFRDQFSDMKSWIATQIDKIAGDDETQSDVDQAQDSLNKEVEELGQLSTDLTTQTGNLEQQFTTDFAIPSEVLGQTGAVQQIYNFLFSSLGIFSIFIWLPVVLAVIKKLLRL